MAISDPESVRRGIEEVIIKGLGMALLSVGGLSFILDEVPIFTTLTKPWAIAAIIIGLILLGYIRKAEEITEFITKFLNRKQ